MPFVVFARSVVEIAVVVAVSKETLSEWFHDLYTFLQNITQLSVYNIIKIAPIERAIPLWVRYLIPKAQYAIMHTPEDIVSLNHNLLNLSLINAAP